MKDTAPVFFIGLFLQCESSAYVPYIDPFVDQLYNLKIKYEEAHE